MADRILVTGATGYVGGRLAPLLLARGYKVRVFVRSRAKLDGRSWARHENLEIVQGDMLHEQDIRPALIGCSAVYYLIHSMAEPGDFSEADRHAAYAMASALQGSGVERVIYLSGVLPKGRNTSPHLKSRAEVGRILALGGVPLTILQACLIIGVGSASFSMLRHLVDRLPIMMTPRWVKNRTQPISMTNVLQYLTGVLEHPETSGQTYEIGGPDVVTYRELMDIYAASAGLKPRRIIPFPGLTPRLSACFVGLVTPVPFSLAKTLVDGLRSDVVCTDMRIQDIIPQELFPVRQAVSRALGRVRSRDVNTSWRDAGMPVVPEWLARGDPAYAGGVLYTDAFTVRLKATPEEIWPSIERIGGETGWYSQNALWKLRGLLDRLMGGPGVQRGRRSRDTVIVGDSLDFWRVMDVRPARRLLLLTEMRLPGEGLLDITLRPAAGSGLADGTDITVSLYYRPRGMGGILYWHAVSPFHAMAFKGMLKAIAQETDKAMMMPPQRTAAPPLSWMEDEPGAPGWGGGAIPSASSFSAASAMPDPAVAASRGDDGVRNTDDNPAQPGQL